MATFRFLHTEFWRDDFFLELTPEDKYFYIYLLTNDVCNQCGIYNFSVKIAAVELGYSIDTVKTLLARFVDYKKILYNEKNNEVMIINWYKYNLNLNNKNSRVCINTCLKKVKTHEFIRNLHALCSDKFKNEMNLVDELFSDVSFFGLKSGISIIESHKEEVIDDCSITSKSVPQNEDKETLVDERPLSSSLEKANERIKRELKPPQYRILPTERYDDEEDF